MRAIVLGDGPMGRAVAEALAGRGAEVCGVLGRPQVTHPPGAFGAVEVAFEFSRGAAVLPNVASALAGGCRRFVIGTTAWTITPSELTALLDQHGAAAVAASSFSPGVNVLTRLAEAATLMLGVLPDYDPYIVEWHRRGKADRPSGTALELARRIVGAHPVKRRRAELGQSGPPEPDELEVVAVRAGWAPGTHLVGFDAPGETVELRLTARNRSAYAAGAIAAAEWLLATARPPGIHSFDEVVDALIAEARLAAPPPAAARTAPAAAASSAP
jgi:4-hydroxy-tetrahydrodipicolinate reductase